MTEIEWWSRTSPAATNTGILTRLTPTLDIDILDPEAATAIEDLVRDRFEERGRVLVRFGRSPKRCIPFRTNTPFRKIVVNLVAPDGAGEKLELLADGQQFVAHGIHPDTGKPYSWHGGEPGEIRHDDLPYLQEDAARALVDDAAQLLVEKFDYRLASTLRPREGNGLAGADHQAGADWRQLFDNIREGRSLHDSVRDLAAKMIRAGTNPGAVVNQLRALMETSAAPHGERRQERYDDIPRAVESAAALIGYSGDDVDRKERSSRPGGPWNEAPPPESEPPPRVVRPTIFKGRTPPPRRWIVPQWVPYGVSPASMATAASASRSSRSNCRQEPRSARHGSAFRRAGRQASASIARTTKTSCGGGNATSTPTTAVDYDALGPTHWMPRLGEDNLLMTFARNGVGELTTFHRQVVEAALDLKARLVIIDTAADTFGGNENDRSHVRQFVQRALGQIALKINGAVLCCAHPSRAGISIRNRRQRLDRMVERLPLAPLPVEPEPKGEPPTRTPASSNARRPTTPRAATRSGCAGATASSSPTSPSAPGMTAMGKLDARDVFLDLCAR